MLNTPARRAPARRSALPPPVNRCACHDCRMHVARLEQLNRQLAEVNDRLLRELEQQRRAA